MRFAPLLLLLAGTAHAELTVSTAQTYVLAGVDNVQVYEATGTILVSPDEVGTLRTDPACLVTVRAPSDSTVLVEAVGERLLESALLLISPPAVESDPIQVKQYLITAKGRHAIIVRSINADRTIDRDVLAVTVGQPKQTGIPPDEFDNIAQRVAEWAAGCTENATYAGLYEKAAADMAKLPESVSITSQNRTLETAVADKITNLTQYEKMRQGIAVDTLERYKSMDRQGLSKYWAAIGKGLRGATRDDDEQSK